MGQIREKLARANDVILTTKGTVGRVAIVPNLEEELVYSPQLCYFRVIDDDRIDRRWLSYWFRSEDFLRQASHRANNTDMAAYINLTDIGSLDLPDVPVEEQRAIAEVLGALDDKIAANRQCESGIDELVRALYVGAVEKSAVPRPFFDVLEVDFGESFKGEHFSEPGHGRPLLRIRDLRTFECQTWTTESRPRETLVLPGDVLVGMDGEFRAKYWLGEPSLLNQRVCRVRGRGVGNALVYELLRAPLTRIERSKTGTTVIHLNKSDLAQATVMLPEGEALATFESRAEPLARLRVAKAQERKTLSRARDALLPLLMSGKVTIQDAGSRSRRSCDGA
nr:restriction endonuclease subunit S [Serinicoccus hydrothermalis]